MKLYYLNKSTLQYKRVKYLPSILKVLLSVLIILTLMGISTQADIPNLEYEKIFLVKKKERFSDKRLIDEIQKYNFKFPHIVYAQALHEASYNGKPFNSNIFLENNNLFGMKQARVRLNLAKGTQFGHAYYESWKDCLTDYALWYSTYAFKCRSEEEMFLLLDRVYAEDTLYVQKLKWIIEDRELRGLFL